MNRRNFLKTVLAAAGASVLPINSVFVLPKLQGIDAARSVKWKNYYAGYGPIDDKLMRRLKHAFKDWDYTQED